MNHASTSQLTLQSEPRTTRVGAKYYVITKGRRLSIFYNSWYVLYIYQQYISSDSTVADPLTGHSTPNLKLKMINENSHYT